MGVIALGLMLPTLGAMVYDRVAAKAPPSVVNAFSGTYTKPLVLAGTSAGLIYLASRYSGMVSNQTAALAATISTVLFAASALKNSGMLSNLPFVGPAIEANIPSFSGIGGGNFGGYQGGYLGYLGNDMGGEHTLYGDASAGTDQAQLFGNVGSSPQVNIF